MPEAQDSIVQEGLKYLGYLFVGLLTMLFGWVFKLFGDWVKKQFNSYVERIENAVGKVEDIAKDIKQLKQSDAEILEEIESLKRSHESHADIQKQQSRDINAIKKHLKLD